MISLTWPASTWALNERQLEGNVAPESATALPEPRTVLERLIESPMFRPRIGLNLRTYDLGSEIDHQLTQHTWAAGGKLGLVTPQWWDTISVGAAVYASFPLYSRSDVDRTMLVAPDGGAIVVPGETYLNIASHRFNLRLFRQLLDAPYLNDQDNRMIPNVFEAYALTYRSDRLYAGVGQITRIKLRNSDEYVPMAKAAGVPGGDTAVTAGGARAHPTQRSSVGGIVIHNWDVFSTAYASGDISLDLGYGSDLRLSAQYTSQRSVGQELLGHFDTYTSGLKADLGYRKAVLTVAGTRTGLDAGIRSPFGQKPSYLGLMMFDFDRPGEQAWLVGLSYRLEDLGLPSWSVVANHAQGERAREASTARELEQRRETDFTVDYRPVGEKLEGMWLRLRYAYGSDGPLSLQQWRVTLNYAIAFGR